MDEPTGTVLFTTVGRPYYGFDVFSLDLASRRERRLTDGLSINFNAQFASAGDDEDDDDPEAVVFVSERTGCPRVYLARSGFSQPEPLPSAPGSLFHDRPILRNGLLYFISAHERRQVGREIARLTPYGSVDYSPAVSQTGKFVAVASYGSRPWGGEFHALNTDIVVFRESDPTERVVVAEGGGWPTCIFRVEFEFPQDTDFSRFPLAPTRVTPPGVHCFTPAAMPGSNKIAVATRRRGKSYRHIEIFDAGSDRWTLIKDRTAFYNSWSPTEKNVIYTSIGPIFNSPKTTVQIARIKFDLSGPERDVACDVKVLTREDTGNNAFPACSPDGKWLVFRSGRTGHKNLFIVDAANGEFDGGIRQLTDGPWIDTMPSWSPNNDLIAFSSNRHNSGDASTFSIYLIRPDGSDLRRVHLAGPEGSPEVDRERINHVCFSRDGEWLLFTANLGGVTAEPVSWPNQFQPYGELYVARLDGSGLKRLTWNGFENGTPAWHSTHAVGLGDPWSATGEGWDEDKLRGQFEEPLWISCNI
ncbi:hypothetical protein EUGRSUZ_H00885 [Eucalyptus grandis]|uniref:Uncharacterized protein n=1 Tax=Eucalyptus grandis TaxID=71139 RepID=A0ACC3JMR6_EUCGR|nr:hypothetical protein EUGRSUZ_H00885 [Eucalyptus grandis]